MIDFRFSENNGNIECTLIRDELQFSFCLIPRLNGRFMWNTLQTQMRTCVSVWLRKFETFLNKTGSVLHLLLLPLNHFHAKPCEFQFCWSRVDFRISDASAYYHFSKIKIKERQTEKHLIQVCASGKWFPALGTKFWVVLCLWGSIYFTITPRLCLTQSTSAPEINLALF